MTHHRQPLPERHAVKTIVHVIGARPNYMKIAPLIRALDGDPRIRQVLVNTGQHDDDAMARAFVRDLDLPIPDHDLDVGSASHAVQTARVMMKFVRTCGMGELPNGCRACCGPRWDSDIVRRAHSCVRFF